MGPSPQPPGWSHAALTGCFSPAPSRKEGAQDPWQWGLHPAKGVVVVGCPCPGTLQGEWHRGPRAGDGDSLGGGGGVVG